MNHELNAQVAKEVMGWTVTTRNLFGIYVSKSFPCTRASLAIPNFSGCLDAAWQMEEKIKPVLHMIYIDALREIVWLDLSATGYCPPFWLAHATPEQRCKAALEAVRER